MIPLYGSGMHDFIMDEIELGTRVAVALDDEECYGGMAWYWNLKYEEDVKAGKI